MNSRQWRMFDKIYAGMLKYNFLNKKVRFISLTSSPQFKDLNDKDRLELIQKNFDVLKVRFEREFKTKFGQYFSCRTLEGYGVIHSVHILSLDSNQVFPANPRAYCQPD